MGSITGQIFSFIVMVCIGILAGILFDVYRVLRSLWRPRKIGTFVGDIFFWLFMTVLVFTLLLVGNWGEIRIYVFLGIAVGCYWYIKIAGKKAQRVIKRIFNFITKIVKVMWSIITWPFKIACKIFIIPLGLVSTAFMESINFGKRRFRGIKNKVGVMLKSLNKRQPKDKE